MVFALLEIAAVTRLTDQEATVHDGISFVPKDLEDESTLLVILNFPIGRDWQSSNQSLAKRGQTWGLQFQSKASNSPLRLNSAEPCIGYR